MQIPSSSALRVVYGTDSLARNALGKSGVTGAGVTEAAEVEVTRQGRKHNPLVQRYTSLHLTNAKKTPSSYAYDGSRPSRPKEGERILSEVKAMSPAARAAISAYRANDGQEERTQFSKILGFDGYA